MSVTVRDVRAFKERGERFVMLTAYDFPTARILDEAGIPLLLVGDSVADNELGYPNTIPVTVEEMLHHTRAVSRGATNALIVGDMPFMSYQASLEDGIRNAGRFLKEGGANAVKVEGGVIELTAALVERGIPVMGHLGLTPQSVNAMGGFRVQGRTDEAVRRAHGPRRRADEGRARSRSSWKPCRPRSASGSPRASRSPRSAIGAGPDCDAPGPGDQRPAGPGTQAGAEARQGVRRPARRDRPRGDGVRRRRARGPVPRRGALLPLSPPRRGGP